MSYKTNPIANRLNINKGFCNTYFLNNKTAYNHNLILWLSLYLFLKSYLAFKKIRLLSCEIRIVSQSHKVLFISILKNPQQKKKRKYKNTYISPINKIINKNAMYLLYKNINNLKKMYIIEKKKSYKFLHIYYKTINKLLLRYKRRKIFNILKNKKINANKNYKIIYTSKLTINSFNALFFKKKKLKVKHIINKINELKKLTIIFRKDNNLKNILFNIWARLRIKNIKSHLNKVIKKGLLFRPNRLRLNQQYFIRRHKELKGEFYRKTFSLKHLRNKTDRFPETNNLYFLNKANYEKWKLFLHRPKIYWHYFIYYKKLNRALYFNLKFPASKKFRGLLSKNIKKNVYQHLKLIKKLCRPYTKQKYVKNKFWTNFYYYLLNNRKKKRKVKALKKYINLIYRKNKRIKYLKKKSKINFKNRKFRKLKKLNKVRLNKKKKVLWKWKKKLLITFMKKYKYNKKMFPINKKIRIKKKIYIKWSLKAKKRKSYSKKEPKNSLTNKEYIKTTIKEEFFKRKTRQTTVQLQFLLEKLISEHFQITFIIKITNLFTLFNNKKIFFETFMKRKKKKHKKLLVINSLKYHKTLSYLKINKFNVLKTDNITNKKYIAAIEKTKENFFFSNKDKILGKSFYNLVNYNRYLNAQLLADEISRVMRKRKHHTSIFKCVKALVEAFPKNSIISYHITVEGKINSKSRATNVTVSQGHIPAQHFSARINFGLAQAKTPTGTFGIRVYIFF